MPYSEPDCQTTSGGTGFAMANQLCRDAGARLCTIDELQNRETRGTGCGYDHNEVYSSTPCGGGVLAMAGNGEGPQTCHTDLSDDLAVRCCADAVTLPCDDDAQSGGAFQVEHPVTEMCRTNDLNLEWNGVSEALGNVLFGADEVHIPEYGNIPVAT